MEILVMLFFYGMAGFGLYKRHQYKNAPKPLTNFWYYGRKIYGWDTNEINKFSERDFNVWRSYRKQQINTRGK